MHSGIQITQKLKITKMDGLGEQNLFFSVFQKKNDSGIFSSQNVFLRPSLDISFFDGGNAC